MKRAFKTEIHLDDVQKHKFHQSVGVCRWLYNHYLAINNERYTQYKQGKLSKKEAFLSGNDFDKYINNEVKTKPEYEWINSCGSKARKKAIMNAETSYKRFFKGLSKFPRFKKKKNKDVKVYFPKNNKGDWTVERHKIKIPTFGWVILKEKGYLPTKLNVISGTISQKADKYFVSIIVEINCQNNYIANDQVEGVGIDLGIKEFAIISNGEIKKNINKTKRINKLKKKLKREQKRLSRKYESLKKQNKREGVAARQNIHKQVIKVQRIHQTLTNIRTDYINKCVAEVIKQNPSFITIEDLNVKGLMKNRHLSKAVSEQKFYEFRSKLTAKCLIYGIELRVVNRFYPSSKLCSNCGFKKVDLKLSDRLFHCSNCNTDVDRDLNASYNLKNASEYTVVTSQ